MAYACEHSGFDDSHDGKVALVQPFEFAIAKNVQIDEFMFNVHLHGTA